MRNRLTPILLCGWAAVAAADTGALADVALLTDDDRSGDLSVFVGALFLVGGIVLLTGAFKIATAPATGGGSLQSALDKLEHIEPAGAFKIGFGWLFASPKQWVFVLTAVAIIFAADLSPIRGLVNFTVFTVLVQAAYLVIIGGYLVARERVDPVLDAVYGYRSCVTFSPAALAESIIARVRSLHPH